MVLTERSDRSTQRVEMPIQMSLIEILIRHSVEYQYDRAGAETENGASNAKFYQVLSPNRYEADHDA